MTQRRVVCSALRAADGTVLIGIRHFSMDMHFQIAQRKDSIKFRVRNKPEQGFVDQHGFT